MIKLEAVILTPDEEQALRDEYDKYCTTTRYWNERYAHQDYVMSFDDWLRAMADNLKDRSEGK